jgi:hypothetical protein
MVPPPLGRSSGTSIQIPFPRSQALAQEAGWFQAVPGVGDRGLPQGHTDKTGYHPGRPALGPWASRLTPLGFKFHEFTQCSARADKVKAPPLWGRRASESVREEIEVASRTLPAVLRAWRGRDGEGQARV